MSKTLVINDLHLGVQRTGGTTNQSAAALREFAHDKHRNLLSLAGSGDTVIVNGDLADAYDIPLAEALDIYAAAYEWLSTTRGKLVWALGNHDLSKDSTRLGTVAFVGRLLQTQFRDQFTLIHEPTALTSEDYIIPHVANQDLFDLELSRIPEGTKRLYLHCNYDNSFAGQADHSLNLSRDQAKTLVKRGMTLILGHEHQGRTLMNDQVIIVGNQFPTSVSDCLRHGDAQADGRKYCLLIDSEDMELIPTWSPRDSIGGFHEVDWRDLSSAPEGRHFIRVTGTADSAEAAAVIKAISSLRQQSDAFVITNAVKVDGVQEVDAIAESIEDIKSVSVLDLLMEMLTEQQQAVIHQLLKEEQQ